MTKIGSTLKPMEIADHLNASQGLDVDLNERSTITAKLSKKGFNIFEVMTASLLLIYLPFWK